MEWRDLGMLPRNTNKLYLNGKKSHTPKDKQTKYKKINIRNKGRSLNLVWYTKKSHF